jgi:multidrug resistance efflux pump
MVIVLALYLVGVWLIFFKLKLLPWNDITGGITALGGVTILTLFYVALQTLTPASDRGMTIAHITEIDPQVQGQVIEVPVAGHKIVEKNELLFRINPRPYEDKVDELKARLVQTESTVAQLKEAVDGSRAQVGTINAKLVLARTRLKELHKLARAGAGRQFDVEDKKTEVASLEQQLLATQAQENAALLALNSRIGDQQSQVAQALAQLDVAQFDLKNTEVRAPAQGVVTMVVLKPGMVTSPGHAVMTFIYMDTVQIIGIFPQKGLRNIHLGDRAVMSFSAIPGRLFESTVRHIPSAIGNAQYAASGQVPVIGESRMTSLYPVYINLPEDFPKELLRVGLAARIRIYSEQAGVVGTVAKIAQWIQTSLAYVT